MCARPRVWLFGRSHCSRYDLICVVASQIERRDTLCMHTHANTLIYVHTCAHTYLQTYFYTPASALSLKSMFVHPYKRPMDGYK